MLSNKEFAATNKVSATLSGDMELFAMFTIDMSEVKVCKGRNANGKRIMELAYPHLRGKDCNLWNVGPISETRDFGGVVSRNVVAVAARKSEKEIREENIIRYAKMVESGMADTEEGLFGTPEEAPLSEDEKFFALDVEMVGGKCRRKGGVKNHAGFESLVDG